ncbi:MAG: ABC transporter ATP-binding protein [Kiritimatiellae bacterium]|nr:ABC transporter ATP-binding protein [Kiritimatiellia bacterium]
MSLLSCHNLSVGYGGVKILEDLNFSVERGDYLCILGENGAGKSTLMKTLLQLIPPEGGTIETGDGFKRDELGYLPQQSAIQRDFPASVREVVLSGCLNRCGWRPFYSLREKALARRNMERMEILPLEKRCYRELSGGQQQRVLLARALCATKKMLLLDEPVAGLDPAMQVSMYRVIEELNKEDRITILMVSHDFEAALTYATHILHIARGGSFFGTVAAYRASAFARSFACRRGEA